LLEVLGAAAPAPPPVPAAFALSGFILSTADFFPVVIPVESAEPTPGFAPGVGPLPASFVDVAPFVGPLPASAAKAIVGIIKTATAARSLVFISLLQGTLLIRTNVTLEANVPGQATVRTLPSLQRLASRGSAALARGRHLVSHDFDYPYFELI
jgi:hypothetical protein